MEFSIVVAASISNMGIGKNGELPWKLPGDMDFFKNLTINSEVGIKNVVIMGRKTWESLPKKYRPLKQRINIIISRNVLLYEELGIPESVIIMNSLENALEYLGKDKYKIFIIGGESIYRESILSKYCSKIYLTQVEYNEEKYGKLDVFFPIIEEEKFIQSSCSEDIVENGITYRFIVFDRREERATEQ